jgi:hypothetical protein
MTSALPAVLFLGLVAFGLSKALGEPEPPGPKKKPPLPPAPKPDPKASKAIARVVASKDPKLIAAAAKVARADGQAQLAKRLDRTAEAARTAHPRAVYKSPFPSVPDPAWNEFVHSMRGQDPKRVTPAGALGLFGFSPRRLADLGLMVNLRKARVATADGKTRTIITGDFKPPLTRERFLADAKLQYETFVRHVGALAKVIGPKYAAVIAPSPAVPRAQIDGKPITLSGLIAVGHMAGLAGLDSWLRATPEVRARYGSTLARFRAATGKF